MYYIMKQGRAIAHTGNVVIDRVRHFVDTHHVHCDRSLNGKAWNITEELAVCPICFPEHEDKGKIKNQLEMFDA